MDVRFGTCRAADDEVGFELPASVRKFCDGIRNAVFSLMSRREQQYSHI